MPKVISLTLYNRPKYSIQILDALCRCRNIESYTIYCQIDYSEIQDHLDGIVSLYGLQLDIHTFIPQKNLGCNKAIFTNINRCFEEADYVVQIEDDCLPSADFLEYCEWAGEKYRGDQSIFAVNGYSREKPLDYSAFEYEAARRSSWNPWGWAIWKDRWEEIKGDWQFGYGPKSLCGRTASGSWDVIVKKVLRKDRDCIFPTVSRIKNIGAENGTHTPSAEWHAAKHTLQYWADDIFEQVSPPPFYERSDS